MEAPNGVKVTRNLVSPPVRAEPRRSDLLLWHRTLRTLDTLRCNKKHTARSLANQRGSLNTVASS